MTVNLFCNNLIRLFKGLVVLFMISEFEVYHGVQSQLQLPTTNREWFNILKIEDLKCSKRQMASCRPKRRERRNRKRNSGISMDSNSNSNNNKNYNKRKRPCPCVKGRKRSERAMFNDPNPGLLSAPHEYRPRIKICNTSKCLTFTNGRKTFNSAEHSIISQSNYIEVVEGSWELCGEFQNTISCGILGEDSYIGLLDKDMIRITTFRRVDDIPEIEGLYDEEEGLEEDVGEVDEEEDKEPADSNDDKDMVKKINDMKDELSGLTDKIYAMEDSISHSNKLLLLDRSKNVKMRKKFMRVFEKLGDT